jgi:hypothetical protein
MSAAGVEPKNDEKNEIVVSLESQVPPGQFCSSKAEGNIKFCHLKLFSNWETFPYIEF